MTITCLGGRVSGLSETPLPGGADPFPDWVEKQTEQIDHTRPTGLMLDLPGLQEVSQQLWALMGPLVSGESSVHSVSPIARHTMGSRLGGG